MGHQSADRKTALTPAHPELARMGKSFALIGALGIGVWIHDGNIPVRTKVWAAFFIRPALRAAAVQ